MDDHLSKPFSLQTMQDMLDRWMPQAASMNRNPPRSPQRGARESREVLDRQVLDQLSALLKPERLAARSIFTWSSRRSSYKTEAGGGRQ